MTVEWNLAGAMRCLDCGASRWADRGYDLEGQAKWFERTHTCASDRTRTPAR